MSDNKGLYKQIILNFILRMTYRRLNDIAEDYVIRDGCLWYTEWKWKVKIRLISLFFYTHTHINCTHIELKNGRRVILGNGIM